MSKGAQGIVSLSAVLVLRWSGASAAQSAADEGARRGFNPQPEPPKTLGEARSRSANPPGNADSKAIGVGELRNPAAKRGFNPQPEPPPKELVGTGGLKPATK